MANMQASKNRCCCPDEWYFNEYNTNDNYNQKDYCYEDNCNNNYNNTNNFDCDNNKHHHKPDCNREHPPVQNRCNCCFCRLFRCFRF